MPNNTQAKSDLFHYKNDYLVDNEDLKYMPITLEEFYRLIFERDGKLPFQKMGEQDYRNLKYNNIIVALDNGDKASNFIVNDDLKVLEKIRGQKFVISSPITYVGRNRNANNSRFIFGFAFDIDGVGKAQIRDIIYQMKTGYIPTANIIVNSGNGVHLYYLFEHPIPLFRFPKLLLKELKYHLTELIWNGFTSNIRSKQFQGIFQGFRLPDTLTKFSELVSAFKTDFGYHTIETLNEFIKDVKLRLRPNEIEILNNLALKSTRYRLNEAKELFPKWYELRIVKGIKQGSWKANSKLYEWWLNKIKTDDKVAEGHRYFCIMILAIYAIKAGINFEKLKADAYSLIGMMDEKTKDADNHFTKNDVDDALLAFKERYRTFPIKDIEKLSGLLIPRNKRKGLPQLLHLEIARATLAIKIRHTNGIPLWKIEGRPTKKELVIEWQKNNPNGTKYRCQKDLKIDKNTIKKWWNS